MRFLKGCFMLIAVMVSLCACSQKTDLSENRTTETAEEKKAENDAFDRLSWDSRITKWEDDSFVYYIKKSSDEKYSWITKIELKDGQTDSLSIPDKIEGSTVLRIGFDDSEIQQEEFLGYNIFGNRITDTGIDNTDPDCVKKIAQINMPDSIQSIEPNCFAGAYLLKSIRLPRDLIRLGTDSFMECASLEQIEMGEKVSEVQPHIFRGCERLEDIQVSSNNKNLMQQGGFLIDRKDYRAVMAVPAAKRLHISEYIQSFDKECFSDSGVRQIEVEKGNSLFEIDGDCVYRSDNRALVVGIVKDGTATISKEVTEINQDSLLAGGKVSRLVLSPNLKYLRNSWLDATDSPECTFVFTGNTPPQIVDPSDDTSMVPVDEKVLVPQAQLKQYKAWIRDNGGNEKYVFAMK